MKIEENLKKGTVSINGFEINGNTTNKSCPECDTAQIYHDSYDAYFCPACNEWLETKCTDSSCSYCQKRPEQPLP
jgi:hypothetical protein